MRKSLLSIFVLTTVLFVSCGNKSTANSSVAPTDSLSMNTQPEYIKADVYETLSLIHI